MASRIGMIAMASATAFLVRDASAKCAMTELEPSLVTGKAAVIPSDGGILVGWKAEVGPHRGTGDPSVTDWRFSVEVEPVTLAPGLTVYRPKAGTKVAVSDVKGNPLASYARDAKVPPMVLPAPMPRTLVVAARRSGRGSRRAMTATLSVSPPDTAVAVILYSSKAGKPISFGRVIATATGKAIVPWADPSRCAFNPPGMAAPDAGDKLVLAWVDQFGRIGKSSAASGWSEIKTAADDGDD